MLDHVSITVSDIAAAEPFYDTILQVLGIVKVGRRDDWLGYGERARQPYRTGSASRSARARSCSLHSTAPQTVAMHSMADNAGARPES